MTSDPLLVNYHPLPRGPRVRLRLAQSRDLAGIRELLARTGVEPFEELELARMVRSDPRRRVVVCATALLGSTELVIGVGALDVDAADPELLIVDRELTDGLDELLREALLQRARTIAKVHAA
jgi:hypothetical protein